MSTANDSNGWVIETPRLVIREIQISDLEFIADMLGDEEVMRFFPKVYSREEAKDWIKRQQERYATDDCGYWLVENKETGKPVGQAGILMVVVDGVEEAAIGYLTHRPFWGQGLATEAAEACLNFAFRDLALPRVITLVRAENIPSQVVALKIGLRPERRTVFAGFEHIYFSTSQR